MQPFEQLKNKVFFMLRNAQAIVSYGKEELPVRSPGPDLDQGFSLRVLYLMALLIRLYRMLFMLRFGK